MKKMICALMAASLAACLFGGCAKTLRKADPEKMDPALSALSESAAEVSRRQFRRAKKERARGEAGALWISPRSDLSVLFRMDFFWSGEAGAAAETIALSIGWKFRDLSGGPPAQVAIREDRRGLPVCELLYDLNIQLEKYHLEIECDEVLKELRLARRRPA